MRFALERGDVIEQLRQPIDQPGRIGIGNGRFPPVEPPAGLLQACHGSAELARGNSPWRSVNGKWPVRNKLLHACHAEGGHR